jgi:RNA polymerase sigma factor (TIGR02999 family)
MRITNPQKTHYPVTPHALNPAPDPDAPLPTSDYAVTLYHELHRLAKCWARGPFQTIHPTALVHEAYIHLCRTGRSWASRADFLAAAAVAMRDVLMEDILRRPVPDPLGERRRASLSPTIQAPDDSPPVDILALSEALQRLERVDYRRYRIVMLRFFAGLSIQQTAEAMSLSEPTVKRDWAFAKAWLFDALRERSARTETSR